MILQITGAPASGKTFSLRNLPSDKTVFIDTDKKGMAWIGWRSTYSAEKKNYIKESNIDKIKSYMLGIVKTMPHVKIIVIDTLNTILTDKLHDDRKKPGFDKWKSLGDDVYELYGFVRDNIPDDIIVIFMAHSEKYKVTDESLQEITHERTLFPGNAATKNNLSKFLNYNLAAYVDNTEEDINKKYKIRTISNGRDETRSLYGVLPEIMPNDINEVIKLIYEKEFELPYA